MLAGFDKYKGGLDTVHDLTGLYSVYTNWRGIEIMFHVSTQLPYESHDPQKVGYMIMLLKITDVDDEIESSAEFTYEAILSTNR